MKHKKTVANIFQWKAPVICQYRSYSVGNLPRDILITEGVYDRKWRVLSHIYSLFSCYEHKKYNDKSDDLR